jgi:chromate transporter
MQTLREIAAVLIRYANLTLGGGSATTAVIHHEIVEKRKWVTDSQFTLSFALARLTPGTNLLAFCVGIGWILRQFPGAIVSLLAASVPCSLLALVVTILFVRLEDYPAMQAAIQGAVAVAVAVTIKTCWTIAHPYYKPGARARVLLIALGAFVLHAFVGVSAIQVLLLGALVGLLLPEVPT